MVAFYLNTNALLYAAFAAWCTFRAGPTSKSIGYLSLSAGGESEYRVIYGGLQLGLGIVFALLARRPDLGELGLVFALAIYGPIVAYRVVTMLAFAPVPTVTVATAALEVGMLSWGAFLWWRS